MRRVRLILSVATVITLTGCLVSTQTEPTPTLYVIPSMPPTSIAENSPTPELSPTPAPTLPITGPTATALFSTHAITAVPEAPPGPCEHFVWPVVDGAVWRYQLTMGDSESQIELSAAVDEAGALLSANGTTSRLNCEEGALAGLPPLPVGNPALGFQVAGNNPSGDYLAMGAVLLPLGQEAHWDMEVDAAGAIRLYQLGGNAPLSINAGRVVIVHQTRELETIVVPAGEFLVLPVEQTVNFDLLVQVEGVSVESVLVNAQATHYYAEGVGLVKADYNGGTISSPEGAWSLPEGATLELLDYSSGNENSP